MLPAHNLVNKKWSFAWALEPVACRSIRYVLLWFIISSVQLIHHLFSSRTQEFTIFESANDKRNAFEKLGICVVGNHQKVSVFVRLGKILSAAIYHPAFNADHRAQMVTWRDTLFAERERLVFPCSAFDLDLSNMWNFIHDAVVSLSEHLQSFSQM